jgi:hypothetical protein
MATQSDVSAVTFAAISVANAEVSMLHSPRFKPWSNPAYRTNPC